MQVQTPKPGWGYQSGRGQGQLKQITEQDREQGREQGRDRVSFPFPFPVSPYMPFPYQVYVDVHDQQDHLLKWRNQTNRNPDPL